jgi:hypothetical protein
MKSWSGNEGSVDSEIAARRVFQLAHDVLFQNQVQNRVCDGLAEQEPHTMTGLFGRFLA